MTDKYDGLGHPLRSSANYFVQDKRGCVGNSALWWRKGGGGYVCDLSEAELFTADQVRERCHRDTDVPWPEAHVRARAETHVDVQRLS